MYYEENEDYDFGISEKESIDIKNYFTSEIIFSNIEDQIEKVYQRIEERENTSDLLIPINDKYNFLKTKYEKYEEFISELDELMIEKMNEILHMIENKFHFSISFSDIVLNNDLISFIHNIYTFFIVNLEEKLVSLQNKYIEDNIDQFKKENKIKTKTDLFYKYLVSTIDPNYINVIFNINENMQSIQTSGMLAEDIIEGMINSDLFLKENFFIQKIFIDNFASDINYEKEFITELLKHSTDGNITYTVQNEYIKKFSLTK